MKGFVGVTDNDWFAFLSQQPGIDEVNFWQPGAKKSVISCRRAEIFTLVVRKLLHFSKGRA